MNPITDEIIRKLQTTEAKVFLTPKEAKQLRYEAVVQENKSKSVSLNRAARRALKFNGRRNNRS